MRDQGINTEIFLESKKFGAQLKYANKKGFPIAIIVGSREIEMQMVKIKNLITGEESTTPRNEVAKDIEKIINELTKNQLWKQ